LKRGRNVLPNLKKREFTDERLEELLLSLRPERPELPMHPEVDDLKRRRVVDAVLAQWEESTLSPTARVAYSRSGLTIIVAVAAGLVALVTGAYLTITTMDSSAGDDVAVRMSRTSAELSGDTQLVPRSRFSLLHGDVTCGDTGVKLGGSVPLGKWIQTGKGQSAFALPTGIAVGMAEYSTARVFWNGNRRYDVEVNQGMALFSVDPTQSREGFFVRTPNGVIRVTGTLFSVAVRDGEDVDVYVHRGKVEIQAPNQPIAYAGTGQTASLKRNSVSVVPSADSVNEISPLYQLGCFDGGQTFSELTENECDRKVRKPSTRSNSAASATHGAGGSAKWRKSPSVSPSNGLAQLLESVTRARRENDWVEVASVYRRILRDYPGTPDSRTALVSLAQVEINRLNIPEAALRHFNNYLRTPGTLEPEALYGKAKVYRQLNNSADEKRTLQKLISKYPGGPLSLAAEKRLRELSDL
jgi:hypothetical protein